MPNWYSHQKPQFRPCRTYQNVIGFCAACEIKVENDLPPSLSEYCDCDQYTRWICLPCKFREERENREYVVTRTKANSRADLVNAIKEGLPPPGHFAYIGVSRLLLLFPTMLNFVAVLVSVWGMTTKRW
jgi:hypothetical protein